MSELEQVHTHLTELGVPSTGLDLDERITWLADQRHKAMAEVCAQRDEYKSQLNASKRYSADLKNELNHALAELHTLRVNTAPEPSRLEIAARILQAIVTVWDGNQETSAQDAIKYADALIAAAKEVAK